MGISQTNFCSGYLSKAKGKSAGFYGHALGTGKRHFRKYRYFVIYIIYWWLYGVFNKKQAPFLPG
jgi:hypothetical protein